MRRLITLAGAACIALLIGTGAFAQVPPNPDNPNDAVPDALAPLPYGEPDQSRDRQEGGCRRDRRDDKTKLECVLHRDCQPRRRSGLCRFEKGDRINCQYASVGISQHKARTATRYRRPTLVFETLIGKGAYYAYLTTLDDVIASRGGNPLVINGKIIGAIGVSGGSGSQDNVVSLAGQAALK